jgi:uncharacterized protein
MPTFRGQTRLSWPVQDVFEWYGRPGAMRRLLPPWEPLTVVREAPSLADGAEAELTVGRWPRWVLRHSGCRPPHGFTDSQVRGPFAAWSHRHGFEATDDGGTLVTDEIEYRLPLGPVGALAGPTVNGRLRRAFGYRYRVLAGDLAAHARYGAAPMTVAVTGASGLIGDALTAFLTTGGHRVLRLVRRPTGVPTRRLASPATTRDPVRVPDEVSWDPARGLIDADALRDADAVVHLAGEPIGGRFTAAHKAAVRRSRVDGTGLLARTLAELRRAGTGPRVLVSGSAIGYYGSDRDEPVDETSGPGDDFLADLCREWEAATCPAREAGLRVVLVRTGVVQSPAGGALHIQLPLFLTGAGGRLGSGRQWLSWVSIDDIVGILHHALVRDDVSGPVNGVAPYPVRNAEYTETLARIVHRPTLLPTPMLGPRLLYGDEGARYTAAASQNVHSGVLGRTGYQFRQPDLETCLRHVLGRA